MPSSIQHEPPDLPTRRIRARPSGERERDSSGRVPLGQHHLLQKCARPVPRPDRCGARNDIRRIRHLKVISFAGRRTIIQRVVGRRAYCEEDNGRVAGWLWGGGGLYGCDSVEACYVDEVGAEGVRVVEEGGRAGIGGGGVDDDCHIFGEDERRVSRRGERIHGRDLRRQPCATDPPDIADQKDGA